MICRYTAELEQELSLRGQGQGSILSKDFHSLAHLRSENRNYHPSLHMRKLNFKKVCSLSTVTELMSNSGIQI